MNIFYKTVIPFPAPAGDVISCVVISGNLVKPGGWGEALLSIRLRPLSADRVGLPCARDPSVRG